MTLHDRDAFKFYMEGATRNKNCGVVPMYVSGAAAELESICTYSHDAGDGIIEHFAIGKVKEN